ncbi:hypothetical protein HDV02_001164 [Globomyces sp. JEL0801]|nr:hypothetical protein HDV02_001164 [Globomyces sp. JEL0801]
MFKSLIYCLAITTFAINPEYLKPTRRDDEIPWQNDDIYKRNQNYPHLSKMIHERQLHSEKNEDDPESLKDEIKAAILRDIREQTHHARRSLDDLQYARLAKRIELEKYRERIRRHELPYGEPEYEKRRDGDVVKPDL